MQICKREIINGHQLFSINARDDQTALLSSYLLELKRVISRTKLLRNQIIRESFNKRWYRNEKIKLSKRKKQKNKNKWISVLRSLNMELEHYEAEAKTKPNFKDGSAARSRSSSPISSSDNNNNNNTGVDASGSTDASDVQNRTHSSPHHQSRAETPAGKREGMQLRLRGSQGWNW